VAKRAAKSKPKAKQPAAVASQVVATIAAAAKACDVHERTLKSWLARGCPGKRGAYDLAAIAAWREANLGVSEDSSEADSRGYWETRRARAAAEIAELDLAQKRRELIDVGTATRVIGQHIAEVKTQLGQLPDFVLSTLRLPAAQKKTARERVAAKVRDLCDTFERSLRELAAAAGQAEGDE